MKRNMALVCLAFLLLFCTPALAGNALVFDHADLLSETEEEELHQLAEQLEQAWGYDFIVMTQDNTNGRSAREYAEDSYLELASGDDGVLYLLDMDNREIYIATSGQMMYYLYDERWNRILDDAYEYIAGAHYAAGLRVMLNDTKKYMNQGIPSDTYTYNETTGEITEYRPPKRITASEGLLCLLGSLLAGGTFGLGAKKRYSMKGQKYVFPFRKKCRLELADKKDILENKYIRTRHIVRSTGSSGGGYSGGHSSTIHTGSGGHSFGGGGRKF